MNKTTHHENTHSNHKPEQAPPLQRLADEELEQARHDEWGREKWPLPAPMSARCQRHRRHRRA